jgi:hypothetical protein
MRGPLVPVVILLAVGGCGPVEPSLRPTRVSQRGNVALYVELDQPAAGPVIVLVDGYPAHSVVVEGPRLVRAQLPSLARTGEVDVEVVFADGRTQRLVSALEVTPAALEVRARLEPSP